MLLDTASLYFRAYFGVPDSVQRPGRHAGERRARAARLHRPAGPGPPAGRPGGLHGRGLAPAVAGRPDPLLQGAPRGRGDARRARTRRRSRTRSPRRCRSSRTVLDALGIARVGVAGYEADDVIGTLTGRGDGPGGHRHRRPRPVPAGRRRARGAGAVSAQGRRHAPADRRGVAAREVRGGRPRVRGSGAAARRPERRAAGRARASARRRRPSCWTRSATWPGSWPRSTTRRRS